MKSIKLKKYLYLLLVLPFVSSCTEKIDMDLDTMDPMPVITGVFSNEEQWVRLNTTSAYLNGKSNAISGADVAVSDGMNSYILQESLEEKGLYKFQNHISINPNETYTLNVQADFNGRGVKQEYSAISKVVPSPPLDSLTIQVMRSFDDLFWIIQINYQEVAESNSYLCRTFVNDMLDVGLSSYSIFDNRYAKGEYIKHKLVSVLFERPFSDEKIQHGDVIQVNFSGITKEYFDFLYGAKEEVEGRNPLFSGPPANIKGNISNGALGIFTAYLSSSMTVTISNIGL